MKKLDKISYVGAKLIQKQFKNNSPKIEQSIFGYKVIDKGMDNSRTFYFAIVNEDELLILETDFFGYAASFQKVLLSNILDLGIEIKEKRFDFLILSRSESNIIAYGLPKKNFKNTKLFVDKFSNK